MWLSLYPTTIKIYIQFHSCWHKRLPNYPSLNIKISPLLQPNFFLPFNLLDKMAPHLQKTFLSKSRVWWRPAATFNDRLITFHNIHIATTPSTLSRVITTDILWEIFARTMDSNLFSSNHHFITQRRFFASKAENQGYIICPICKDNNMDKFNETPIEILGDEHFGLPSSLVFSILELRSLWCKECKIQLFKWYIDR